jgi:hypothetical protein
MSEHYEDEEEYEGEAHELEEGELSEDEIWEIQEEYRRKRLVESLIGPIISTAFHVVLIVILAIFITDQFIEPAEDFEVTMEETEEVVLEEPPPVETPEPTEVEETDTTTPVLTTVAIEDVQTDDAALEDTSDDAPSTDDNMQDEAVSDVVVSPSAFASPSVYGGRSAAGRASSGTKFGANKIGQANLMKALWWLKKVQNPDGSWGENSKPAMTGLALLTFLAHGETPTSKHFGTTVKKAMQWLVEDPINVKSSHGYPHAIKTYALAEAYAMTGISMLEEKMNACIRILIKGQQAGGSYNYNYSTDEKRQDLSFAGWNFQALKAANGAGCDEPGLQEAIYKAVDWLKKNCATNTFNYTNANNVPKGTGGKGKNTMRAVGTLCMQLFGAGDDPGIEDELYAIAQTDYAKLSWEKPPGGSLYCWYYATQAMFQAGGDFWAPWNKKFQKELNDNQNKEGYWVWPGGGHVPGGAESLTGKVYATTLCALQLTVYYRYLPSSKGGKGKGNGKMKRAKKVAKAKAKEVEKVMEEEGLDLVD